MKLFTLVSGLVLLSLSLSLSAQPVSRNFDVGQSGSYVIPAGYTATITVQAWGGGGGGEGSSGNAKGGGGGGGYTTNTYTDVPAGSYAIVVGAGGAPGVAGGSSSYTFPGGIITAGGGAAGISGNAAGGTISPGAGTGSKAGGKGGSAHNNNGGGGGGGSETTPTDGGAGTTLTGGAPNGGKGGTQSGPSIGTIGLNGINYGGGGGGNSKSGSTSGSGAPGRVEVMVVSVLPVELLSFTGKSTAGAVLLTWETATELNNEKFIIERSADGRAFAAIGEERGVGTTQEKQSYHFADKTPERGLNYYRLQQLDYDGQFEYSKVEALIFDQQISVVMYPSPTTGLLNIRSQGDGPALVQVFGMNGQLLQQQSFATANSLEIDLSQLPNGVYLVAVQTGGQRHQERVMKF
ncbi:MAG: hypothetical protein DA408_11430 [Bacteroidetes bacterium]|nr:MAG: hypothetical protein DA408_11430 [Bacteroidota bacterium]